MNTGENQNECIELGAVVSRNPLWDPQGHLPEYFVNGFTGVTEQSGNRPKPVPSPC